MITTAATMATAAAALAIQTTATARATRLDRHDDRVVGGIGYRLGSGRRRARRRRRRPRRAAATDAQKPSGASRDSAGRAPRAGRRSTSSSSAAPFGRDREPRLDRGALVRRRARRRDKPTASRGRGPKSRASLMSPVTPSAASDGRSRRRPRWIRDRTVPMGTPVASAICSYERSLTSQSTTGTRNSSGSSPSACWISSDSPVDASSAAGDGGSTRPGSSGSASVGRRFRRRISSRNTFVTIRANQPSSDPGS